MVRKEFPSLLTQILRKNRCFSTLPEFMPIFLHLQEKGCVLGDGYPVLKALAEHPLDSLKMVDLSGVCVTVRQRFARGPIWEDYLSNRLPALLAAAKKAPVGATRNELLAAAVTVSEDAPDTKLREEAAMAASLFDTDVPVAARVAYAMEDEIRVKYAETWTADFPFGALSFFFRTPPPASYYGLSFGDFLMAAKFFVSRDGEDARACIENAVLTSLLDFLDAAGALCREPWWEGFYHVLVASRLGKSAGLAPPAVDWRVVLSSPVFLDLEELISKHFKGSRQTLGGWYLSMKSLADELRARGGNGELPHKAGAAAGKSGAGAPKSPAVALAPAAVAHGAQEAPPPSRLLASGRAHPKRRRLPPPTRFLRRRPSFRRLCPRVRRLRPFLRRSRTAPKWRPPPQSRLLPSGRVHPKRRRLPPPTRFLR